MTEDDTKENLLRAIMLLDCALPYFERAAAREAMKPANAYGLKEITQSHRLEAVEEMISEVGPLVGYTQ